MLVDTSSIVDVLYISPNRAINPHNEQHGRLNCVGFKSTITEFICAVPCIQNLKNTIE